MEFLYPFVQLISTIISIISLCIFVWVILNLLINFDIVNRHNPMVQKLNYYLTRLLEPLLQPIRRVLARLLPDLGGIDLSPLVLLLLLQFIDTAMHSWLV